MKRHIIRERGELISLFSSSQTLAIDTETYGLDYWDKCYSIQITDGENSAYVNLNPNGEIPKDIAEILGEVGELITNAPLLVFTNAKFDLHKMRHTGVVFNLEGRRVWDTPVFERMIDNDVFQVGMDASLKKRGREKDTSAETYIEMFKLTEKEVCPITGEVKSNKRYSKIPFDIMLDYGFSDVENSFWIYQQQVQELTALKIPQTLIENELVLMAVIYKMEARGFKVDQEKIDRSLNHERTQVAYITQLIEEITGREYSGGPIWLAKTFDDMGIPYTLSDKKNPEFAEDDLMKTGHELGRLIVRLRGHEKNISTFYTSFKKHSAVDGKIHAEYNLASTRTGRLSCSNPNIQQTSKEEDTSLPYSPRGCFIPSPDHVLVAIDYRAMEYCYMVDLAGEKSLLGPMIKGMDIHEETAKLVTVSRPTAKTVNFLTIYGGGAQVLADTIKVTLDKARDIKYTYFQKLPFIKNLLDNIQRIGKSRGYVHNWAGRQYRLKDPNFAYKLPNYIIQGGCSDVVKFAMVKTDNLLASKRSGMVAMMHDELIIEVHKEELDCVWEIKRIMESIYKPYNGLGLTTSVDLHKNSWAASDAVSITTEEELHATVN